MINEIIYNKKSLVSYIVIFIVIISVIGVSYFTLYKQEKSTTIAYTGTSSSKPYWDLMGHYLNITANEKNIKLVDLSPDLLDNIYKKKALQKALEMEVD